MAIFKCSWIVLKKSDLIENQNLLTVFTREYWKININYKNSKTQKSLDIGFIIDFETNVKSEKKIVSLSNVHIKSQFNYENKDYNIILEYLNTIFIIQKLCPLNLELTWIYEIVESLHKIELNEEKLIFAQLKIVSNLWLLNIENNDLTIKKILSFVQKNSILDILKLKWLNEDLKTTLKQIIKSKLV